MTDNINSKKIIKQITDIGCSAFMRMEGWRLVGKSNRSIFFEINAEDEKDFDTKCFEYSNSVFATFDHNLLTIKKLKEYMPE